MSAALSIGDRERLSAIRSEIDVLSLDEGLSLQRRAENLRELLDTEKTIAYSLGPSGDRRLSVEVGGAAGTIPGALRYFDEWLGEKVFGWTGFNPIRPERAQRNVVLRLDEIYDLMGIRHSRVMDEFFPKIELDGRDQLRVLVCEGPSLLAWVGGFQPDAFTIHQKTLLAKLTPSLQRRLTFERRLGGAQLMRSAFVSALEAIGSPAFLVSVGGVVLETNAAGKILLTRGRRALSTDIADAARHGASARFTVTPIDERGSATRFLVVERATTAESERIDEAAKRWLLSPRQTRVLELVAEAHSNKAIAAILEIAERTVETHLTAIYARAQLEGRSQLLASLSRR